MEIDEFDALGISFAMEFEKNMNLNINNHKNEVDLYLMESLEKKSIFFDILMWWILFQFQPLLCCISYL